MAHWSLQKFYTLFGSYSKMMVELNLISYLYIHTCTDQLWVLDITAKKLQVVSKLTVYMSHYKGVFVTMD